MGSICRMRAVKSSLAWTGKTMPQIRLKERRLLVCYRPQHWQLMLLPALYCTHNVYETTVEAETG
jgi:hypothetical protein